ncbi:hypothetical protein GF312_19755 [Candidatus Poribacteria bacterium]|nr:hypothetical protein [Candidatus Poribacteria bacterium]
MEKEIKYELTSNYEIQNVEGWKIYVNKKLLDTDAGKDVLKLMDAKLFEINRTVPDEAIQKLYDTKIWLEAESKQVVCACYHPSEKWLIDHDFNPEKAKSVEIGNPDNFLNWTKHQFAMVLHELAHAYHHQVLCYDNPHIKEAYKHAVEAKLYDSVLRYDGDYGKAYALNNDQEYFAEQTEAYFSTNDFYPFVKAELMKHDPLMYETLKKLWLDS